MNNLQSAFFRNCSKAEKHADDIHRMGRVLEVHVHPVELVCLYSWVLLRSQFLETSATFYGLTSVKNTATCPFRWKPPFGKKPTHLTVSWFRSLEAGKVFRASFRKEEHDVQKMQVVI